MGNDTYTREFSTGGRVKLKTLRGSGFMIMRELVRIGELVEMERGRLFKNKKKDTLAIG